MDSSSIKKTKENPLYKDNEVKISLLIPIWNKTKYLKALIKNLNKQFDKKFKVIFLDDKSTDHTLQMLHEILEKTPIKFDYVLYEAPHNLGIADARNFLIEQVQTEYFFFLDPDDLLSKKAIYHFNRELNKYDYDVVYANNLLFMKCFYIGNIISDNLKVIRKIKSKKNYINPSLSFAEHNISFIWNKAINKKWYDSLNISFLSKTNYEDIYITSFINVMARSSTYINKKTYFYNFSPFGLSSIVNPKKISDIYQNLNQLYTSLEDTNKIELFSKKTQCETTLWNHVLIHVFSSKYYLYKYKQNIKQYHESLKKFIEFYENLQVKHLPIYENFFKWLFFKISVKNMNKMKKFILKYEQSLEKSLESKSNSN